MVKPLMTVSKGKCNTGCYSWLSFAESDATARSLSTLDMVVNASLVPDTKLIRPLRCGVCRGEQSSNVDCDEERRGYGERAEEGFSP
jgi:hypothetical protein